MRYFVLLIVSWLAGLGGYLVALRVLYGETPSRGDFPAILLASTVAAALSALAAYAPAFLLIRRLPSRLQCWWMFALVGAILALVPGVILLAQMGPVTSKSVISPEAALFWAFFVPAGIIGGLGFWHLTRAP
jgi:hypothetical protein